MAYETWIAERIREDIADEPGITEKKMFGGLCFLKDGNMLCGAFRDRGMFRVGKARQDDALAIDGTAPMAMGGRTMGGIVEATGDAFEDDSRRGALMSLALEHARALPPK